MLSEIFNSRMNYSDRAETCSIKLAIDKQLEGTSGKKRPQVKIQRNCERLEESSQMIVQNSLERVEISTWNN